MVSCYFCCHIHIAAAARKEARFCASFFFNAVLARLCLSILLLCAYLSSKKTEKKPDWQNEGCPGVRIVVFIIIFINLFYNNTLHLPSVKCDCIKHSRSLFDGLAR